MPLEAVAVEEETEDELGRHHPRFHRGGRGRGWRGGWGGPVYVPYPVEVVEEDDFEDELGLESFGDDDDLGEDEDGYGDDEFGDEELGEYGDDEELGDDDAYGDDLDDYLDEADANEDDGYPPEMVDIVEPNMSSGVEDRLNPAYARWLGVNQVHWQESSPLRRKKDAGRLPPVTWPQNTAVYPSGYGAWAVDPFAFGPQGPFDHDGYNFDED